MHSCLRCRAFVFLLACVSASCSGESPADAHKYITSGDQYVAGGKNAEAIIEYRNALKADPKSGEARFKLAEAYSKSSDPFRAFTEYVRAADLMPENREAQVKAAGALLLGGRFEDAKKVVERLLKSNPKDGEALLLYANAMAGLKDLDSAIKQVEEAITLDPAEPRRRAALGSIYMAQGDATEAEAAFKKALELRPGDTETLLALGNFYWSAGRNAEAEGMFKQALASDPNGLAVNRALATLYASTQRMAQAEPYLKRVVALSPGMRSQLALADYYVSIDRTSDARQILMGMQSDPTALFEAKARLAALDYESGKKADAYKALDEILASDEKNLRAHLLKVRLLVNDGRLSEAEAESALALKSDATSAAAHFASGVLKEAKGDRTGARLAYGEVLRLNPRATQAQLRLSDISLREGTLDLAVQFASQALADEPLNDDARMKLARALLARRDVTGAKKEVDVLLARYPASPSVQVLAGLLKTQSGDMGGARVAFNRALAARPKSPEALAGLLAVDAATNNLGQSRARIEKTVASAPDDPDLLLVAARMAMVSKDWPGAESTLRHLLEVDADNMTGYAMLGTAYATQGRLDDARREFEKLAEKDKTSVSAATMVGVILHTQNRLEETKTWYERVLRIDPNAPVAANNLAWLYAESKGNLDRALQLADMAASRLPKNAEVSDTLGWVRYRRGEFAQAVQPFARSVEQAPDNPLYSFHLGLAQAQAGNKDEARKALERALSLQPNFQGAAEARRVLETL